MDKIYPTAVSFFLVIQEEEGRTAELSSLPK